MPDYIRAPRRDRDPSDDDMGPVPPPRPEPLRQLPVIDSERLFKELLPVHIGLLRLVVALCNMRNTSELSGVGIEMLHVMTPYFHNPDFVTILSRGNLFGRTITNQLDIVRDRFSELQYFASNQAMVDLILAIRSGKTNIQTRPNLFDEMHHLPAPTNEPIDVDTQFWWIVKIIDGLSSLIILILHEAYRQTPMRDQRLLREELQYYTGSTMIPDAVDTSLLKGPAGVVCPRNPEDEEVEEVNEEGEEEEKEEEEEEEEITPAQKHRVFQDWDDLETYYQ